MLEPWADHGHLQKPLHACPEIFSNFDVVGWFVGSNLTQLEKLPWESYTTIRHGDVIVDENGFPSCSNDKTFLKAIELAKLYNKCGFGGLPTDWNPTGSCAYDIHISWHWTA